MLHVKGIRNYRICIYLSRTYLGTASFFTYLPRYGTLLDVPTSMASFYTSIYARTIGKCYFRRVDVRHSVEKKGWPTRSQSSSSSSSKMMLFISSQVSYLDRAETFMALGGAPFRQTALPSVSPSSFRILSPVFCPPVVFGVFQRADLLFTSRFWN